MNFRVSHNFGPTTINRPALYINNDTTYKNEPEFPLAMTMLEEHLSAAGYLVRRAKFWDTAGGLLVGRELHKTKGFPHAFVGSVYEFGVEKLSTGVVSGHMLEIAESENYAPGIVTSTPIGRDYLLADPGWMEAALCDVYLIMGDPVGSSPFWPLYINSLMAKHYPGRERTKVIS